MPSKPARPAQPAPLNDPAALAAFDRVMRALVKVPKSELDAALGKGQPPKAKAKKKG